MFTGIITNLGRVAKKQKRSLTIKTELSFLAKIQKGISVSVNGICLTVVQFNRQAFTVDFIPETEQRTNIKYLKPNDLVNLELPATPASFLSGHLVQGHVDGVAKLIDIKPLDNSRILKFVSLPTLTTYITEKGSIAVNGISLTVMKVEQNHFTVGIIPHTWTQTMSHTLKLNYLVNIEVDILAKYIEKLLK